MRVQEGWPVLWRAPGEVQVGIDAPGAVVVEGLGRREQEAVLRLGDGLASDGTAGRAARRLLEQLGALAAPDAAPFPAHPEAGGLARLGADPGSTLARRARCTVALEGTGPVARAIGPTLAAAGVGTLVLLPRPGARPDHDGVAAAASRIRRDHPRTRVRALRSWDDAPPPDLALLVRPWVVDPATAGVLAAADVPHLPVVTRDLEIQVGPLVLPGRTPCLRCEGLARTRADPAWPALATQLACASPPSTPPGVVHRGVGLAAQAALAHLDGRPGGLTAPEPSGTPGTPEGTPRDAVAGVGPSVALTVSAADLDQRVTGWWPLAECGCIAVP